MELCDLQTINAILRRHGFNFKKSMGQNFLTAAWVPERIAEVSGTDGSCGVLEIGPGIGCLTSELAKRAGRVTAVELDRRLLPVLRETVGGHKNVTVVPGDVMKLDLEALVREHFAGLTPTVCANLPYNITSPVLTKLIESRLFARITVMVQREVALRIAAAPGTADYGAFTLLCQLYTKPTLCFDVPPDCFEPQPKVTSAVVRLDALPSPAADVDEAFFFRTVRAAFGQRRKTLVNALSSGFPQIPKEALHEAVTSCGLAESVRGEALSLQEFAALSRVLRELGE